MGNTCPQALLHVTSRIPTISKYLERLESTVLRRTWAERAAVPVCSKYAQALLELLTSVKRAVRLCPATTVNEGLECKSWECNEGWVLSNTGWEIWTGSVTIMEVDQWKTPNRSIVRTLMDGGEGPPLLREGCTVMRGVDWKDDDKDGKDLYENDKLEKEEQKRVVEEEEARKTAKQESDEPEDTENNIDPAMDEDPTDPSPPPAKKDTVELEENDKKKDKVKKKKKKKKKK